MYAEKLRMTRKLTIACYLLTVLSLPFVNVFYFHLLGQKILITEILFLVTAFLFLFSLIKKQIRVDFRSFYIPLALYLAALTLSTVFSVDRGKSTIKLSGVVYLVGLAILSFCLIKDLQIAKKVCKVWLFGSFLTSLVVVATIFLFYFDRSNLVLSYSLSHYGTLPIGNYPRIQSTFLNPNMYCHYLSISWMILFCSFKMKWIGKAVFVTLLLLLIPASVFTISPGLGGILLGIGLWLWILYGAQKRMVRSRISIAGAFVCAVAFFIATIVTFNFSSRLPSDFETFGTPRAEPSVRIATWRAAVQMFYNNPVSGKGLGTNAVRVEYILPTGGKQVLGDAHQLFLNVAAENGIFGLLTITFVGIYIFRNSLPFKLDLERDALRTGLGIAFFSCFFYQGLSGSYEDARHLWVLIGFLGAVSQKDFSAQLSDGGDKR